MIARFLLFSVVTLPLLSAWGNCQEQPTRRNGRDDYVRIEIKGRLKVEKPDPRSDRIVASIGDWSVDLTDEKGRPDRGKAEAAKKFDGKVVIVTGRPYIAVAPDPALPNRLGNNAKIIKSVMDATIKSTPD